MSVITAFDSRGRPTPTRIRLPSERRSASRTATRALDVLEYLGHARRPLRAVEISRAMGLPSSTTNQLLKTMVESSHLIFNARRMTYLPSPRLAGFSGWLASLYGESERLRDLVHDVCSRTGMVSTLTTANDTFMQVVEFASPSDTFAERGQRVSLFGSSPIGSAYLSTLDSDEIYWLLDRAGVPESNNLTMFDAINAIRRDGFADGPIAPLWPEERCEGWAIAVPLPANKLPVQLVLAVGGSADRVRPRREELYHLLREAIERAIDRGE